MTDQEAIKNVFDKYGPVLRSKTLRENGFYNQKLQKLIDEGVISHVRRGYYIFANQEKFSDSLLFATVFPDAVLCMESALWYYGYIDKKPSSWHLAVPDKTSRVRFRKYPAVFPHFIVESKFEVGIETAMIGEAEFKVYDRERTICDCLLHRNKMDFETFSRAIQGYVNDEQQRKAILMEYGIKLHVTKKVRDVLGAWL